MRSPTINSLVSCSELRLAIETLLLEGGGIGGEELFFPRESGGAGIELLMFAVLIFKGCSTGLIVRAAKLGLVVAMAVELRIGGGGMVARPLLGGVGALSLPSLVLFFIFNGGANLEAKGDGFKFGGDVA